jgi:CDP-glucose 4,6-dehydratase
VGLRQGAVENLVIAMAMDIWNSRNVLVTGGTGMVGSHLCESLLKKGANAICLVRSKNPKAYFYTEGLDAKAVSVHGDLRDYGRISEIVSRYEIDTVFHVGAQPIVGVAEENPLETLRSNIDGTMHILEACRRSPNVRALVVASSDKSYGASKKLPYTEDMPMNGIAPYEVSKSCTDMLSLSYAKTYGLPIAVTRFGNIYGAGDLNFNRIIPGALRSGISGSTLELRSDGKMVREYLHVEDVCSGYLFLAENIARARGEAYNFGSGERLSVLDAVDKVGIALGKKIGVKVLDTAKNEIHDQWLDSSKARKLGWKSVHTMESGLAKTVGWYRKILG